MTGGASQTPALKERHAQDTGPRPAPASAAPGPARASVGLRGQPERVPRTFPAAPELARGSARPRGTRRARPSPPSFGLGASDSDPTRAPAPFPQRRQAASLERNGLVGFPRRPRTGAGRGGKATAPGLAPQDATSRGPGDPVRRDPPPARPADARTKRTRFRPAARDSPAPAVSAGPRAGPPRTRRTTRSSEVAAARDRRRGGRCGDGPGARTASSSTGRPQAWYRVRRLRALLAWAARGALELHTCTSRRAGAALLQGSRVAADLGPRAHAAAAGSSRPTAGSPTARPQGSPECKVPSRFFSLS
ncbi:translation initiation factor IF-2-like [Meles meles]|uniref:translation initiation factor IF-2-like n=1 Tax=Meles meles TaxID=9662 RepID=UPI001E69DC0A|nr:translation initiation factor IF-2-like [Meles meles]